MRCGSQVERERKLERGSASARAKAAMADLAGPMARVSAEVTQARQRHDGRAGAALQASAQQVTERSQMEPPPIWAE